MTEAESTRSRVKEGGIHGKRREKKWSYRVPHIKVTPPRNPHIKVTPQNRRLLMGGTEIKKMGMEPHLKLC